MNSQQAREEVIIAALSVVSSRLWSEAHPEDPHHADSEEMADDMLTEALFAWAAAS